MTIYYGGHYRNSPTFFRTVPSPTPCSLQDWAFATPTQNCNRSIISNGQSYGLQIWLEHSLGPFEQKLGRKGSVDVPRDCPNFLVPPIISRRGKATTKFCTHIHRIDRTKNPLKISAKVAMGAYSGTLENCQSTNI